MQSSWKYWDLLIVIGGLVIGFGVWFIPSFQASPEFVAFEKRQVELRERREAREAQQAAIEKEREELGIIYFPSPVIAPEPAAPGPPK